MLTRRQRGLRVTLIVLVSAGLLWGTFGGDDEHFPFGPFRMYSTSTRGEITVLEFHGVTTAGTRLVIPAARFGLRRAELEGQRRRLDEHPELLDHIVESYEIFNPDAPRLEHLAVVHAVYRLDSGRPVWTQDRVLATWTR
jgi:hypothetical protein